jgi:CHAT domain
MGGDAVNAVTVCETTRTEPEAHARAARCYEGQYRRTGSVEAALRAAHYWGVEVRDFERARSLLLPLEAASPSVPLYLGYMASEQRRDGGDLLGLSRLARDYDVAAFEGATKVGDDTVAFKAARAAADEALYRDAYIEAFEWLDRAQLHAQQVGGQLVAEGHEARALALRALGDAAGAEREFSKARSEAPTAVGAIALSYTEGRLRVELGQLSSGQELLEECAELAAKAGLPPYRLKALLNAADASIQLQDWARAESELARAEEVRGSSSRADRTNAGRLRGRLLRKEGRLDESARALQALNLEDDETGWMLAYEMAAVEHRLGALEEAARLYRVAMDGVEKRQSKSVDFQRWYLEARRKPYEGLFALLVETGDGAGAVDVLERLQARSLLERLASQSTLSEPSIAELVARRSTLVEAMTSPEEKLAPPAPGALVAPLLFFVEAEGSLFRGFIHADDVTIERLATPAAEVCDFARELTAMPNAAEPARWLGEHLLSNETLAILGPRFAILASQCLENVPFAALLVGGQRLVARAIFSLVPDIQALRKRPDTVWASSSVVVGAPLLPGLPELPAAVEDLQVIGAQLHVSPRRGTEATMQALRGTPRPSVLFVATHAALGPRGPVLALADGELAVQDILEGHLGPQLAVIASCNSASGFGAASETLAGAFLRAGSQAVLATLGSVEDTVASRVVQDFFRRGGTTDPARALAEVQRALSASRPPEEWATFVMEGTPNPLSALPARAATPMLSQGQASLR